MIGFLRGEPQVTDTDALILLTGGVGYEVMCTPATLSQAAARSEVELWIYTQVREDALQLYGFPTRMEKQLFLSLIKVNGIGPRSALHILGATSVDRLIGLIQEGNAKELSQLPKVGKKTAEQIILTLKGKLVDLEEQGKGSVVTSSRGQIVSALVNLGFRLSEVEKVVNQLPHQIDLETGVREGLAALTN